METEMETGRDEAEWACKEWDRIIAPIPCKTWHGLAPYHAEMYARKCFAFGVKPNSGGHFYDREYAKACWAAASAHPDADRLRAGLRQEYARLAHVGSIWA